MVLSCVQKNVCLHSLWLAPVTLTLLGFGSGAARAAAQATYPFEAIYNTEITFSPITPNISVVNEIGESGDAPYGLTNFVDIIYTEFDPGTGVFTFGSDPARFGLEGLPIGTRTFFGNGSDKLFGTISGTAAIDLENLVRRGSATITITGGEGRFRGATGILDLSTNDPLTSDPTAPTRSQVLISGSSQTVPEPSSNITLIGIKVIGFGFLLQKRCSRRKSAV